MNQHKLTKTWKKRQRSRNKNQYKQLQITTRKLKEKENRRHGNVQSKQQRSADIENNTRHMARGIQDQCNPMPKQIKK